MTSCKNYYYSFVQQLECLLDQELDEQHRSQETLPSPLCKRVWDKLLCWPPTPPGTIARLPCFSELNGIHYDTSSKFFSVRLCQNFSRLVTYMLFPNLREKLAEISCSTLCQRHLMRFPRITVIWPVPCDDSMRCWFMRFTDDKIAFDKIM